MSVWACRASSWATDVMRWPVRSNTSANWSTAAVIPSSANSRLIASRCGGVIIDGASARWGSSVGSSSNKSSALLITPLCPRRSTGRASRWWRSLGGGAPGHAANVRRQAADDDVQPDRPSPGTDPPRLRPAARGSTRVRRLRTAMPSRDPCPDRHRSWDRTTARNIRVGLSGDVFRTSSDSAVFSTQCPTSHLG